MLKNIYNALKHHNILYEKIARKRGRIYIETNNTDQVASALTRIFGISSVSPATRTSSHIDAIVQKAVGLADKKVNNGDTFAVRCHRVGSQEYSSMDVCRRVGKEILTELEGRNLHVNLENPRITMSIEVREAEAYIFTETLNGAGGFPVNSQARVIGLLSGGIDSPVACWLAMKRGCTVLPVYFDDAPLTDEATTAKALDSARRLFEWSIGYTRKIYVVPHGSNLETLAAEAPRKITCLLCKRLMYRVAEKIAEIEQADGIVTGESIGEQASQTLTNLRVLDEAAIKYPVHRPLLGFDKTETEALARKIGTYNISIRKSKACSAAPHQPATKAQLRFVKNAEKNISIDKMVSESVQNSKVMII